MTTTKVFYGGDTIKITGKHLLNYGKLGTVSKWVHDDVYVVTLLDDNDDDGQPRWAVLKAAEMEHCILLPHGVGD